MRDGAQVLLPSAQVLLPSAQMRGDDRQAGLDEMLRRTFMPDALGTDHRAFKQHEKLVGQ